MELAKLKNLTRPYAWRLGRKLYMWGRGDVPNMPESNGEYWMLRKIIRTRASERPLVLFDIGCNKGEWTDHALRLCLEFAAMVRVHTFEPETVAYRSICSRFAEQPVVTSNNLALSDHGGTMDFYVVGAMAGTNTLAYTPLATRVQVPVTTFDRYCTDRGIDHVDYVKSDAEGFDSQIIAGAREMLRAGRVGIWQFEYNSRWIEARRFIRDVFDAVKGTSYVVGKLVGAQVEIYQDWHSELDRFFEGNYLLIEQSRVDQEFRHGRFNASNVYVCPGSTASAYAAFPATTACRADDDRIDGS